MSKFNTVIHWSGQYLLAASSMFMLLEVIDMLRGEAFGAAWRESLAWAVLAAAIFIGSRYYQAKRGAACAVCKDPPARG
ncbi:hypothetical protein [Massilia consociata]|uniref:Uncharacterized protein n=1 Tax=Massilia consociata TaxID=760117 RepID=A0ABV6FEB0_9BURK